jgi:hypothetical protein
MPTPKRKPRSKPNPDAPPKRKRAPNKTKRIQDATSLFIEAVKATGTPVPPEHQLIAQANAGKPRSTVAGSLEEFNSILAQIKRKLKYKGVASMDDLGL